MVKINPKQINLNVTRFKEAFKAIANPLNSKFEANIPCLRKPLTTALDNYSISLNSSSISENTSQMPATEDRIEILTNFLGNIYGEAGQLDWYTAKDDFVSRLKPALEQFIQSPSGNFYSKLGLHLEEIALKEYKSTNSAIRSFRKAIKINTLNLRSLFNLLEARAGLAKILEIANDVNQGKAKNYS